MSYIEPNILLAIVIIFGVLVLSLIGILSTYIFMIRKNTKSEARSDSKDVSSEKLLAQVHERSIKVLEDAHKKAREILSSAEDFLKRDEGQIKDQLEKISQVYIERYQASLENIKLEAIKTIHNIPKDIDSSFQKSLVEFQKTLQEEIDKTHLKLAGLLSASLENANEEVEKYKLSRMKQIDDSALEIVFNMVRKVLGKDLTLEEHEKLVKKALEEAKKQGMFEG